MYYRVNIGFICWGCKWNAERSVLIHGIIEELLTHHFSNSPCPRKRFYCEMMKKLRIFAHLLTFWLGEKKKNRDAVENLWTDSELNLSYFSINLPPFTMLLTENNEYQCRVHYIRLSPPSHSVHFNALTPPFTSAENLTRADRKPEPETLQ